jgi:type I restriction enzyme M protein
MLLSAVVELRRRGEEWRTLKLYGQERNLMTSGIARMNLFLHGIEDFEIVRDDTLARPRLMDGDRLRRFDVVLANPPYSIKQWDRKAWSKDPYGRNRFGVPPQGRADYAFWQHILASLKPGTGRCAILFPHGVLFRDEEQAMRKRIAEADLIECVLGLGPNLFYNSPMEACVVICRASKPAKRKGKILLINALKEVTRERAQSFLEEPHIEKIVSAYRGFADIDGFAAVATNEQVAANNYNLSIPLYLRNGADEHVDGAVSLADALDAWETSSVEVRAAMGGLFKTLEEAGLGR